MIIIYLSNCFKMLSKYIVRGCQEFKKKSVIEIFEDIYSYVQYVKSLKESSILIFYFKTWHK